MQKGFAPILIIVGLLILAGTLGGGYYYYQQQKIKNINSFEECAKEGYPVMQIYPPRCNTPDGRSFTEELSEEEKEKLNPPQTNETVNWEVYTDTKYNFQISYPQTWRTSIETYPEYNHPEYSDYYVVHLDSLETGGVGKGDDKPTLPTYSLRVTIYVKNEIITNLEEEAKRSGSEAPQCSVGSPCEIIPPKEIIKKSDNYFKEFYSVVTANNLRHTIFPIPNNPKSFVDISTWYTWPKDDFDLYDKIISTFKFLDQEDDGRTVDNLCTSQELGGPFKTVKDCGEFKVLVKPCCDQVDIIVDSSGNKIAECGGLKGYSEECKKKFSPQTQCSVNSC